MKPAYAHHSDASIKMVDVNHAMDMEGQTETCKGFIVPRLSNMTGSEMMGEHMKQDRVSRSAF